MNATLDTNVMMSGVFFGGIPGRILEAWRDGRFDWFVTDDILEEYHEIAERLHEKFPRIEPENWLRLVRIWTHVVEPAELMETVCEDPDDDKFIACALATHATIVSGDHHLLDVNGYAGVVVKKPREFIESLESV